MIPSIVNFSRYGVRPMLVLAALLGCVPSQAALKGEYFAGRTLNAPLLQRTDPNIAFSWGEGSPDPALPENEFSARWTGFLTAAHTETYTLYIVSDNGSRLKLNGKVISDAFDPVGGVDVGWTIRDLHFTAGERVPFELEYYESTGGAELTLYWYSVSQPFEAIPASAFSLPESAPLPATGWTGRYFDGRQFEKPVVTRADAAVNFEWPGAPAPGLFPDNFSVKWSGLLTPAFTEIYTFTIAADNGTRLWIDGKLVSSAWDVVSGEDGGWRSVDVPLTAGRPVPVLLDYYQGYGSASAALYWMSPGQPWEFVPGSALTPLRAGTAPWLARPADRQSTTGTAVNLPVEASDASGAVLTYSATGLPPGVRVRTTAFPDLNPRNLPALETVSLSGMPWKPGLYEVQLAAQSTNGTARTSFIWTVTGPVTAPDTASALALVQPNLRIALEQNPVRFTVRCLLPDVVTRFYQVRLERSADLLVWEDRTSRTDFFPLPASTENLQANTGLRYEEPVNGAGTSPRFYYRIRLNPKP